MAVEARRGCGYRKLGGLYLVGGGIGIPCDRLPIPLDICPCCGQGIKQSRGWTWVDVGKLVNGRHRVLSPHAAHENCDPQTCVYANPCPEFVSCPLCGHPESFGKAGLLWIGERFYKTPGDFIAEGVSLGFSRRIRTVPRGFKPGETYVLLAHPKAVEVRNVNALFPEAVEPDYKPGIFYLWLPQRLEKIVAESARDTDEIEDLEKRGITPIFVPDDDADHQGSVFDKEEKGEE